MINLNSFRSAVISCARRVIDGKLWNTFVANADALPNYDAAIDITFTPIDDARDAIEVMGQTHGTGLVARESEDVVDMLAAGDACLVGTHGEITACYTWVSTNFNRLFGGPDGHVPDGWAYGYKAFVSLKFRRQGLYKAILIERVRHAATNGRPHLFWCVDSRNRIAVANSQKLGFETIGSYVTASLFGRSPLPFGTRRLLTKLQGFYPAGL